jgi:hypothetical protein
MTTSMLVQVVGKYFKFISPEKLYTYKDIIKLGQSYKNAWDYEGFMIDPYNSLIKEGEMSKNIGWTRIRLSSNDRIKTVC